MPRLSIESKRGVVALRSLGYSVKEIQERLTEEEICISRRAMYLLMKKKMQRKKYYYRHSKTSSINKLNHLQVEFIDNCMAENDCTTSSWTCFYRVA